jgi:hypothetical protein
MIHLENPEESCQSCSTVHVAQEPKDDNKDQDGGNASATKLPRSSARQNSS